MDIGPFIVAFGQDWITLMSGVASVILSILSAVTQRTQRRWFGIAALVCFVFASARIWTTEHHKWLAEVEHNLPLLSGGIIATNHHPISDRTRSGTAVLLIVEIRNEGADSLVDSFEVTAESDGVRTLGELHHVPKSLSLSGPKYKGPLVYYGKDEIFTKTALDPIRRGSKAVGLIWAWFPKIAPQTFDVKSLRVSCADIRRKRYTIGLEKDFMPSQPMYVPGLSTGP